ncbi:MAG: serine/threonine protein kinase, partial [Candidatus Solibacter sp.]|nr:serine/threonine protein kinase [Candidatus Solibacter sp.]
MVGQSLLHYTVLERLGSGGMGVVYRARDTRLDRLAAIKVLRDDAVADMGRQKRFIQEAKAASGLNHPNIITIYDISTADGVLFMAMELVTGHTLEQLIARKPLPWREALKYAVQVAGALSAAHEAGIIHRDIKPANIMVSEKGWVKVLDFGLAKLSEHEAGEQASTQTFNPQTEEGTIVGTIAYMS